jgi:hypothetical protein
MNEERTLQALVAAARPDQPPIVDVAGRVLTRLRMTRPRRNLVFWLYTGLSSAAAVFVVAMVVRMLLARQDAMLEYALPTMGVMP